MTQNACISNEKKVDLELEDLGENHFNEIRMETYKNGDKLPDPTGSGCG